MALDDTARYVGPLEFVRMLPLNDDYSQPSPSKLLGGIGPFDFSAAATPSAVAIKWKIDAGAEQTDTIDLSGASSISAVTATEWVAAVTAAAPTGLTASVDTSGRAKIAMTTPGTTVYFQFYGEGATGADFGQGYGVQFLKSSTMQSAAPTVNRKDDETLTITDAQGRDTEVIRPGYRKSVAFVLTDTSRDFNIAAMILGVTYDGDTFEVPTSENEKTRFLMELYAPVYRMGTNDVMDKLGYDKQTVYYCTGNVDGQTLENTIAPVVYNLTGVQWRDGSDNLRGDSSFADLTVAEYEALAVETT